MPVTWYDGVQFTIEASLPTVFAGFGIWDTAVWDAATWGPDESWEDISELVKAFEIDRRFAKQVQVWETGTCTLTIDNADGRFSPSNLSGRYVVGGRTMIRVLVPIRITATYQGVTYPLYRGYAKTWDGSWIGGILGLVTVPCVDVWELLATDGVDSSSPVGAGDTFGQRVQRILSAAGYAGERVVDVGTMTMQATSLSDRPVDELVKVALSEGGAVYVGPSGELIAERQYALAENTRSVDVQATFGDGPGELPCEDIRTGMRGDLVRNVVSYTRIGGTPQIRADAVSRALTHVDRKETQTGLYVETDDQADQLAAWMLARYKDAEEQVTGVDLAPLTDARLWPQVFGRTHRDLIRVIKRPEVGDLIDRYCHISGIHFAASQDECSASWDLWSATPYRRFAGSRWDHDRALWGDSDDDPDAAVWFY